VGIVFSSGGPEDHMQQLFEFYDSLKSRFGHDDQVVANIQCQIEKTNDWISNHADDDTEKASRTLESVEPRDKPISSRSIFDDIDADESTEV
jgi:hypothetical protein